MGRIVRAGLVVLATAAIIVGVAPVQQPLDESPLTPTKAEIAFFSNRVALNPNDVVAATRLGVALRQDQRETGEISSLHKAAGVLDDALVALPGYTPAQVALARVLIDLHRFQDGLAIAQSAFASNPDSESLIAIGDAQLAMGSLSVAEATYAEVARLVDSPALDARFAHLAELRGEITTAINLMEEATAEVRADANVGERAAWFSTRLADLYLAAGNTDSAELSLNQAIDALPGYSPAIAGLADVALARGDLPSAIDQLNAATLKSTDPDWHFTLARIHRHLGNEIEAAHQESLGLETVEDYGEIHPRDFALYHSQAGEHELAYKYARAALSQSGNAYSHDAMAWVLFRSGSPDQALAHSEIALAEGIRDATFSLHHGAILMALGREADGRAFIEEALAIGLDPWDAETAKVLIGA